MENVKGEITVVIGHFNSVILKMRFNDDNCRKKVYFNVFENDFFCNTIYDDLLLTLKEMKCKKSFEKIIKSFKMVDLDISFLNYSFDCLSYGSKSKCLLAKELIKNPKVFYLDEPFLGLDQSSKRKIVRLFKMMKIKYGKKFLIALDDIDLAFEVADNLIVSDDDGVVYSGDKYKFFTSDLYLKYGFSLPKIVSFVNYVRKTKSVKLNYRDDISDLMKDIYRFVR